MEDEAARAGCRIFQVKSATSFELRHPSSIGFIMQPEIDIIQVYEFHTKVQKFFRVG